MLAKIKEDIIDGNRKGVAADVQKALDGGIKAEDVLNGAMIPAMAEVGQLFEQGEFFIPEMLVAARTMAAGMEIIKPLLKGAAAVSCGKVVIGTVAGDLHDIGKNLVALMLEGNGFEVVDLGSDVAPEAFVAAVREHKPQLVAMSALVTTTMPAMGRTIEAITAAGLRDQVKVMVGGAPLSPAYSDSIGADGYSADANAAVALAKRLVCK